MCWDGDVMCSFGEKKNINEMKTFPLIKKEAAWTYLSLAQSLERQSPEKWFAWFWCVDMIGIVGLLFDASHCRSVARLLL